MKRIEQEIDNTTKLLEKTRKDRTTNLNQLKLINSRISSRRELVSSLEQQMALLEEEIADKESNIEGMNSQLSQLKEQYAEMVREAYKNHKLNNFALFLFASRDFNDATRRIDFMRRYNRARESRALLMKEYSDSLTLELAELNLRKEELAETRASHSVELDNLSRDEREYRTSVNRLKQEESKISKELKAKRDQMEKFQQEIQKLIAEEAKKNKAEVRTAAQEEALVKLTGKFEDNKGKLPLPIRGGVIIDKYGKHPHPTQKGLTVNNRGINIAGERGAEVKCVFEGEVSRIFAIPGYNTGVMVRHGKYILVYANLTSVSVKKGDKITLNQRIGRLSDSTNPDDVFIHIEIWEESSNLNPEPWFRK